MIAKFEAVVEAEAEVETKLGETEVVIIVREEAEEELDAGCLKVWSAILSETGLFVNN